MFTSYEREGDGSDYAMNRELNIWFTRFYQPDPFDGSYNLSDPQSFNRYSYVQNDPVNSIDPSGLDGDENHNGDGWCVDINGNRFQCDDSPNGEIIRIYTWDWAWGAQYGDFSFWPYVDRVRPISEGEPRHGRGGGDEPHAPAPQPSRPDNGYWKRFWQCFNDFRLDNALRAAGESVGHPAVGEFAAGLTISSTIAALANQGLNLTRLGVYPRASAAGPAGTASSWQHGVSMRIRSLLGISQGNRWMSDVAKPIGGMGIKNFEWTSCL